MAQIGTGLETANGASKPGRVDALDGLRFLAAAFIVLYHYGKSAPVPLESLSPVFGLGWMATDFFLILSGFVLGRAYGAALDEGRIGHGQFVLRRIQRIWPAHLIVLVGFVGLLLASLAAGMTPPHPEHFRLPDLIQEALLIQAWGFSDHLGWNAPSWSLSALVVCYAFFPLVWRWSFTLTGRVAALLCAFDVLALVALGSRVVLHEAAFDLSVQHALVRAIPLFLCGLFLARAASGLKLAPREAFGAACGVVAAIVLLQSGPRTDVSDLATVTAIALGVLAVNASAEFRSRLAARAGALSFSLFITHSLSAALWFGAIRVVETRLGLPPAAQWALWAAAFPFALLTAWVFDRMVDTPVQKVIKALGARRTDSRPVVVEA